MLLKNQYENKKSISNDMTYKKIICIVSEEKLFENVGGNVK